MLVFIVFIVSRKKLILGGWLILAHLTILVDPTIDGPMANGPRASERQQGRRWGSFRRRSRRGDQRQKNDQ